MSIPAGTRLGRYEVVAPIGAGGMGEVYRARDLELDRIVAVKVLPTKFAAQGELRARFEREARAISALSHPHICTLHDVGREGDVAFFVMELLDGESLAERLAKGPLPVAIAITIAAQIASALAAAHRRGIIHRDLKPANVMLSRSGVKLLDFGIARMAVQQHPTSDETALPTVAGAVTTEGTILGTLQYMAPEQLEGKPTDARADVFSFGCMLYEMIAGRRAFGGGSQASLITAIMSSEPTPLPTVAPVTPPAIDRLVRKCLAKSPDDRWQSAADLETELRWIADDMGIAPREADRLRAKRAWVWPAVAIAAVALLIATIVMSRRGGVVAAPLMRTTIPNPGALDASLLSHQLSLSPDGRHVAFLGTQEGKSGIWIRSLAEEETRLMPDTAEASGTFWSPDSATIAYFTIGKLMRIDRAGGEPEQICATSVGAILHGTWGADGTIVFAELTGRKGLFRVPAAGGEPALIAGTDPAGIKRPAWPTFIGDSKRLLYCTVGKSGGLELNTVSLDPPDPPRSLGPTASRVQVVGDAMLFARDGTLFAQRFDASSLQRKGEPVAIAPHVHFYSSLGSIAFSAAPGVLVYISSAVDSRLTWFDRAGNLSDFPSVEQAAGIPRITRDGKKVAFAVDDLRSGTNDIEIADLVRGTVSRLSATPSTEGLVVWSPDASKVAFSSDVDGAPHLFLQTVGTASPIPLTALRGIQYTSDWSADGKTIVFDESNAVTRRDIFVMAPRPNDPPRAWLQTPFAEQRGRISPDGRWMAFTSNASGRSEIYLAPFDKPTESVQVSRGGAFQSAWRADGSELFYNTKQGELFSVAIRTTPALDPAPPKLLFQNREGTWDGFDVMPDGSRFLVTRTLTGPRTRPIEVVTNWRELLREVGK